jgi:5'-nucleotidase
VFEKRQDPRGKTYYWLAGEAVEEADDPTDAADWPADVTAIRENYITLTPLQYNLTAVRSLDRLQTWLQSS